MLRITIHNEPARRTFQLEGKLAGPWVDELGRCWQSSLAASAPVAVRFDLTGVTFIDAAGKEFLAERYADGAELIVAGCQMRAFAAEIANAPKANAQRNGVAR